jgi:protoheme IX farnesyltransferase
MFIEILSRIKRYWPLIKSLQTSLLLFTGLAGFVSAKCPYLEAGTVIGLLGSLSLAVSGSTVLNMVYDRNIDARMARTCLRPIPAGSVSPREALSLGIVMTTVGIVWSFLLSPLYGLVVFAGFFFDVVIYSIVLKRRTPWAVIWGGIAGGMPVLAGRVLAIGTLDWVGMALACAVLFWIPTHILTFTLRHQEDYAAAKIPTFPARYGEATTQRIIALSTIMASIAMGISAVGVGLTWGYLRVLIVLSLGLFLFALGLMVRPSARMNFGLFKYASLYMLGSMLIFAAQGL